MTSNPALTPAAAASAAAAPAATAGGPAAAPAGGGPATAAGAASAGAAAAPAAAAAAAPATEHVVAFKKSRGKKKKKGGRRPGQRKPMPKKKAADGAAGASSSSDGEGPDIVTVNTKRRQTVNTFGTASLKKRARGGAAAAKRNAVDALAEVSDRSTAAVQNSGGATATAEFDTAVEDDERSIRERNIALNESGAADDATTYRGQAGYKNYIKKDKQQLAANKFTGTQGPIRPSVFFRPSFRMDYQPDVCKDYKDTGYCGFGDTCKFMHDRGNYKQGWQIEQEFQAAEKKRKAALDGEGDDGDAVPDFRSKKRDDSLPFACLICRQRFTDPVETKCGHYFCEECALERFRKDTKCFACGKETRGVFNTARKILERMEQEDEAEARKSGFAQ